jgi:hypothetical protein
LAIRGHYILPFYPGMLGSLCRLGEVDIIALRAMLGHSRVARLTFGAQADEFNKWLPADRLAFDSTGAQHLQP